MVNNSLAKKSVKYDTYTQLEAPMQIDSYLTPPLLNYLIISHICVRH